MKKKGQAAMEFLMTYGWAILAAIIVIGILAVYFRPTGLTSGQSRLNAPFYLVAANVQSGASPVINLDMRNDAAEAVIIAVGGIDADVGLSAVCTNAGGPYTVAVGANQTVSLGCPANSIDLGDTISGEVTITYTKASSSLALQATGNIAEEAQ